VARSWKDVPVRPSSQDELPHFSQRSLRIAPSPPSLILYRFIKKGLLKFLFLELIGLFTMPVGMSYLFSNLFGVLLLLALGTCFFFYEKIFSAGYLSAGLVTKVIGILNLVLGAISLYFFVIHAQMRGVVIV